MSQPVRPLLKIVVCGAGPAGNVGQLVELAQVSGWDVELVATPPALDFLDLEELERLTGHEVRSQYSKPGQPRSLIADALVVAPATYNTVNKLALGISDTYALGVLAEGIGKGIPTVILPFVNSALASRTPFQESVASLRNEGVTVLLGWGMFEPHPPGTGGEHEADYPWKLTLESLEQPEAR